MAIFWTIFAGVTVFVVGQTLQRLFIEPIQEQRRIKGRIAHALTYYRDFFFQDGYVERYTMAEEEGKNQNTCVQLYWDELMEFRKTVLELAAALRGSKSVIPFYNTLARLGLVIPTKAIEQASYMLLRWRFKPDIHDRCEYMDRIQSLLHIDLCIPADSPDAISDQGSDPMVDFPEAVATARLIAERKQREAAAGKPPSLPSDSALRPTPLLRRTVPLVAARRGLSPPKHTTCLAHK